MNIDLLYERVKDFGHVCAGLDTCIDYVPPAQRRGSDADSVLEFNKAIIDAAADVCACFKVQIAYYEEMGLSGLRCFSDTLKYVREKKCLAIADIKRGDIGDTALRYAKAHFNGDFEADFVTLNPYMGMDTLEPWVKEAKKKGKGAFVLMRTSNPGMKDFEYIESKDGRRLYNAVGGKMKDLARENAGLYGYGMFGIVVGCTETEEAARIRSEYENLFFLIPGYGAQGGAAKDAALLLRNGNGGVVNASRSIITAWQKDGQSPAEAARTAAVKMRDEIKAEL